MKFQCIQLAAKCESSALRAITSLCRVSLFCRVFFPSLSNGLFSALDKEFGMPSAIILPSVVSAALDKQLFCRVPDGMHSVNILALGKSPVSDSGGWCVYIGCHNGKCGDVNVLMTEKVQVQPTKELCKPTSILIFSRAVQ